jgi:hypothetical protein
LRAVGLSLTRIVPTNSLYSTTEAVVTYAGNLTRREENHLPFAICHFSLMSAESAAASHACCTSKLNLRVTNGKWKMENYKWKMVFSALRLLATQPRE